MTAYLLDTDICIYVIRKRPAEVLRRFAQHSPDDIAVSAITLFELQFGIEKSRHKEQSRDALAKFMQPLVVLDLDSAAASDAANMRSELEGRGTPIGPYDLLIAATARSKQRTLVSNNTEAFARIGNLQIENWAETTR